MAQDDIHMFVVLFIIDPKDRDNDDDNNSKEGTQDQLYRLEDSEVVMGI